MEKFAKKTPSTIEPDENLIICTPKSYKHNVWENEGKKTFLPNIVHSSFGGERGLIPERRLDTESRKLIILAFSHPHPHPHQIKWIVLVTYLSVTSFLE